MLNFRSKSKNIRRKPSRKKLPKNVNKSKMKRERRKNKS